MKILIAEDDVTSRRLLEATLSKWGYEVVVCHDGQKAWEALQGDDAPRFAILDWMMPQLDGLELCRRVRQKEAGEYTYIVLLTAKTQREDLITGMDAGADDYVTKPFNRQELRVRLRAGRRILELQEALINARDQMKDLASRDPLTGLWNRNEIFRILENELARAQREGKVLAVIMADLDHFKRINDTYGHLAGDSVLRATASRLRVATRPYDAVSRYGGEEFMFVINDCDNDNAAAIAERVRRSIESSPMDTSEGLLGVTMSLGVSTTADFPDADPHRLLHAADAALYMAKDAGRNRVEVAKPSDFTPRTMGDGAGGQR
ncbi:MAG TPA: diguanylate cyclase [Acidobacteriota bacterium]|nr:diguanylate cyclase [Acidobacteriota bacterium]